MRPRWRCRVIPDAAGTAAALLGAGQFGLGAAVAPLVGVLGNDELALAAVMTAGSVIALVALLAVGVSASERDADVPAGAVAERPDRRDVDDLS